jgi:hypothetical protein
MIVFDQIRQLSQLKASPPRWHLFEWCYLAMQENIVIHKIIDDHGITLTLFYLHVRVHSILLYDADLHAVRHRSSSTAVRTRLLLDRKENFLLSKRWP